MQIYLRFSERKYLRPQVKGTNKREENQILFEFSRAEVPKTAQNYIRKKVYTAMVQTCFFPFSDKIIRNSDEI